MQYLLRLYCKRGCWKAAQCSLYVHCVFCLVVLNFRVMLPELVSSKVGPRAKKGVGMDETGSRLFLKTPCGISGTEI